MKYSGVPKIGKNVGSGYETFYITICNKPLLLAKDSQYHDAFVAFHESQARCLANGGQEAIIRITTCACANSWSLDGNAPKNFLAGTRKIIVSLRDREKDPRHQAKISPWRCIKSEASASWSLFCFWSTSRKWKRSCWTPWFALIVKVSLGLVL